MAADTTQVPAGTTLTVNNGGSGTYQVVGRVTSLSFGGKSFAQVVATWLSSPAADRKPGLLTNSPAEASFKYTRATYTQLLALAGIDSFSYKITTPAGDVFTLDGWVTDVPPVKNSEAESTQPLMIDGVKIFVRSFTWAAGTGTE